MRHAIALETMMTFQSAALLCPISCDPSVVMMTGCRADRSSNGAGAKFPPADMEGQYVPATEAEVLMDDADERCWIR